MASNSYDKWNNISANFSGSTGFMRNALDGMGQAGTIFSRGAAYFQEEQKRQEALAQNQFENDLALQEEARLARVAEADIAINQNKEQRDATKFGQEQEEWIDKQMAVDAYNTFIENTDLESRKDGSYRDSAMYENMPAAARAQLLADWMAFAKEDRDSAESHANIAQTYAEINKANAQTELFRVQQAALLEADKSGTGTGENKDGKPTTPSNNSYTATFKNDLSRLNSIYTDKRFANMGSVASALITFNNTLKTLGDLTSEEQDQIGKAIRSVDQGDMSDEDYIENLNENISTALTIVQDDRAKNKPPEGNTPSAPTAVGSGSLTSLGSDVQEATKGLGYSFGKVSDLPEDDAVAIARYDKNKSLFEQPAPLTAVLTNTKDPSKVVSDWLKYKGDTTPETITAEEIPLAAKLLFINTLAGEGADKARSVVTKELYNRFNNPQKYTDGKRNYNHLSLEEFRRLLNTSL